MRELLQVHDVEGMPAKMLDYYEGLLAGGSQVAYWFTPKAYARLEERLRERHESPLLQPEGNGNGWRAKARMVEENRPRTPVPPKERPERRVRHCRWNFHPRR
ncbi:MAG: hypothetical protein KGH63_04500 [Candidatus Micrarchaeota archaeon]|nr:hypothetical protein [Candidatus Micrarchaeota archaeon]